MREVSLATNSSCDPNEANPAMTERQNQEFGLVVNGGFDGLRSVPVLDSVGNPQRCFQKPGS